MKNPFVFVCKRIFFVSLRSMRRFLSVILLNLLIISGLQARTRMDSVLINRIFNYPQTVDTTNLLKESSFYRRFYIKTDHRNALLMAVPAVYWLAKGSQREFVGETWTKVKKEGDSYDVLRQVFVSTTHGYRSTPSNMLDYLKPDIYNVYLTSNGMLSPFHRLNHSYYKYKVTSLSSHNAEIAFQPRVYNTKLVSGSAIVEPKTGRIISFTMFGEFDLLKITMSATMGEQGDLSLYPDYLNTQLQFRLFGNRFHINYFTKYMLPQTLPDSIIDNHDRALIDSLRPDKLPEHFEQLYHTKDSLDSIGRINQDTIKTEKKRNIIKDILWYSFADHLLNRTRMDFGKTDEGYIKIDPLLNPLYFGYNNSKGFTYKIKVRMAYNFNENNDIDVSFKGGYTFKEKQFYFRVPVRWTFNKRRNAYAELMIGNGNRISNASVREQIQEMSPDSINWDELNLDYFKDTQIQGLFHYDLSKYFSVHTGFIFHRRTPVDYYSFSQTHSQTDYRSFAPLLEIEWRPFGWTGLAFTANYERGIKGIARADMEYERIELDGQWKKFLNPLRLISLRLGSGFYTNRAKTAYFLDYSNFNREYVPGGWNDDWSGDFQLLNNNLYNSSRYYIRCNITYESPMLITYRIPFFGRYIESERIYINALRSSQVNPYMEYGYGFTNRLFSMGIFLATNNWKYDGIGFQFGFELFSRW